MFSYVLSMVLLRIMLLFITDSEIKLIIVADDHGYCF